MIEVKTLFLHLPLSYAWKTICTK